MLVVTRKKNESLLIQVGNEKIEIKIVCVRGSATKLGINAGKKVRVWRKEIADSTEVCHGMVEVQQ